MRERGIRLSRGRRWAYIVLILALPAIASPLLFIPVESPTPKIVLSIIIAMLEHPIWWANAATVVAILGARRFAESRFQESVVCILIIMAWSFGCDTVAIINHMF